MIRCLQSPIYSYDQIGQSIAEILVLHLFYLSSLTILYVGHHLNTNMFYKDTAKENPLYSNEDADL